MKTKPILPLAAALATTLAPLSQAATIFTESLGTVTATTAIAAHETANGFDNDDLTFSGIGDVRTSTPSTTAPSYAGASGTTNVFLNSAANRSFQIDGINTNGYEPGSVTLSFGAHKSTTASTMATLLLDFSTDGINWTNLPYTQPSGTGTAVWRLVTLEDTAIPTSPTLSLRWTNTDASVQYRLDDIQLSATPVPETSATLLGALGTLALLRRRRNG